MDWKPVVAGAGVAAALGGLALVAGAAAPARTPAAVARCAGDNGGITLPPGFCATVFADNLGAVRHMAVAADGTLYANTWNGSTYFRDKAPPPEGFLIALKDANGDGVAESIRRFGLTPAQGSKGGTGLAVYKGFVYAEMNDQIVRYPIPAAGAPSGQPEVVLSGMPLEGDHPMHPFVIDAKGQMFVDMGSATNACQTNNRQPGAPGANPCTELETRGGVWLYSADELNQKFSPNERYATGIRNAVGLAVDASGRLFATQHGRDQLLQNWPKLYPDAKRTTELPSEELLLVRRGGDYGWPYCYYDGFQKKLVLAPEYGGDGGNAVGVCARKLPPVAAYPAHWAPDAVLIYERQAFPDAYRGGAFIAFHGSWNRAPEPQAGYNVVFQPLQEGTASGPYVVFADGFAGPNKAAGPANYRPSGLAVAPDGSLYISDDAKGRIWKVTYRGPQGARVAAAPPPRYAAGAGAPGGVASLRPPPGGTAAQLTRGAEVYRSASCAGCHGQFATGGELGPPLNTGAPLWTDGSLARIKGVISKGVPQPKQYRSPMPPMGGAQLSNADLDAVAAYVWAVGHKPN